MGVSGPSLLIESTDSTISYTAKSSVQLQFLICSPIFRCSLESFSVQLVARFVVQCHFVAMCACSELRLCTWLCCESIISTDGYTSSCNSKVTLCGIAIPKSGICTVVTQIQCMIQCNTRNSNPGIFNYNY